MQKCREAGVKIGFGTDAGTPGNAHGKQALEFKLMVDVGFTPAEVLQAATRVNAKLIRKGDVLGTIEQNKWADFVAMETNPLEDIEALQRISFVMKAGKIIKQYV